MDSSVFGSTLWTSQTAANIRYSRDLSRLPARTKLVIMCLDQHDTTFAANCLRSGIDYMDISANLGFFAQMEIIKQQEQWTATALLSVGIAPGLSNLLAKAASRQLDQTDRVDIAIMLGLGDEHGAAAVEWTVDSMHKSYSVVEHGQLKEVRSFTNPKRFDYGFELGKRTAYRFPFSDQQTVARTLQVPSVSTYLGFDSQLFTFISGLLQRFRAFNLLRRPLWRKLAITVFGKLRLGSDVCALSVCAEDLKDGKQHQATIGLKAYREGELTARVAIAMAESLYTGNLPNGIYHSEQLFGIRTDKQERLYIYLDQQCHSTEGTGEIIISDVAYWIKEEAGL